MSTSDTKKAAASARRAAAIEKQRQADANGIYLELGAALRAKDHKAAERLFKAGAAVFGKSA